MKAFYQQRPPSGKVVDVNLIRELLEETDGDLSSQDAGTPVPIYIYFSEP